MIQKFYRSIREWIPKHLTVYGRICAAKSYIASKSWYLASVIPPQPKAISKIKAVLWNFVQNNNCLEEDATNNHYLSRWSSNTLRQTLQNGGLNAQQFDFQLAALHSKWIVQLIDPSTKASWKALPYSNLMENGLDNSLFIADKSVLTLKSIPSRWKSYLTGWFAPGLSVAEPPMDFECLLNESLWFNRFIRKENGQSFGHYLTHQKTVSNGGPFFISDIVKKFAPGGACIKLTFLNEPELRAKYDANTAKVLVSLIECIPLHWRAVIYTKVREPFLPHDWIVERKYVLRSATRPPEFIYRIAQCLSGKVTAAKYTIDPSNLLVSRILPDTHTTLSKAHIVKASVTYALSTRSFATFEQQSTLNDASLYYNGSYADQKLLLCRISWFTNDKPIIPFHNFSIRDRYRSINDNNNVVIASIARWCSRLSSPNIDWPAHFKYLNDPLLHNRTKELLYKIYTRACMTGLRVEKFGHPNSCTYCDAPEDELHLFIECGHIQPIWSWLQEKFSMLYANHNIQTWDLTALLFGYNIHISTHEIAPWKLLHAETLRAIWLARNENIFRSRMVTFNETVAVIKCRVLQSIQVFYHNLRTSYTKNKRRRMTRFLHLWTQTVPMCRLNDKGYLALSPLFDDNAAII
jgi:hypothetical protein